MFAVIDGDDDVVANEDAFSVATGNGDGFAFCHGGGGFSLNQVVCALIKQSRILHRRETAMLMLPLGIMYILASRACN